MLVKKKKKKKKKNPYPQILDKHSYYKYVVPHLQRISHKTIKHCVAPSPPENLSVLETLIFPSCKEWLKTNYNSSPYTDEVSEQTDLALKGLRKGKQYVSPSSILSLFYCNLVL